MKKWAVLVIVAMIASILPMTSAVSANAGGPSWVWGINPTSTGEELVLLDAWTGTEYARFSLPDISSTDTELALAGSSSELFYVNGDVDDSTVYVLDAADASTSETRTLSGSWDVDGLGYWTGTEGNYIYTSGCTVEDLHRCPAAGDGPTFFWSTVFDPQAVGGDDTGRIFTTDYVAEQYVIAEIDPVNDVAPLNTFASPSQEIVGMAFDGEYLYASDTVGYLYTMDPETGEVLNSLELGYVLYALAVTDVLPPALVVEKIATNAEDQGDEDGNIELNERWVWVWEVTVTNVSLSTVNSVVLKDNLGGDLELLKVRPEGDLEWTDVVKPGDKKKESETFAGVEVLWTGKSAKIHWSLEIGDLEPGVSSSIELMVATDVNPGGHQQYTSLGEHCQNSGATAKGLIDNLYKVEGTSDPICVEVVEEVAD